MLRRQEQIKKLETIHFDVLVIGGGATGAGIALDAAARGLHVALVEAYDFSSGTSSRSTKLIHGGMRYLEAAFKRFDYKQFRLVKDSLQERDTILRMAPHLTRVLPIIIPLYSWFDAAYYWIGVKAYDGLAGQRTLGKSRFISSGEVLKSLPQIKERA